MKKIVRISIVFIILLLQLIIMPTIVKADNIIAPADSFIQKGSDKVQKDIDTSKLKNANDTTYNVLLSERKTQVK